MILADTSVWVEHFRHGSSRLKGLLENGQIICHPFVIGELACGNLKSRKQILLLLSELPSLSVADHHEVLELLENHKLSGQGIGWVDAHLLASVLMSRTLIWTIDRRLSNASSGLSIDFSTGR